MTQPNTDPATRAGDKIWRQLLKHYFGFSISGEMERIIRAEYAETAARAEAAEKLLDAVKYVAHHDYRGSGFSMTNIVADMRHFCSAALDAYYRALAGGDSR